MANLRTRLSIPTPEESFDALFGSNKGGIDHLNLVDLQPYPNQPFRPYTEDKLQELIEDIKLNGVLSPIIVRPMPVDEEHPYKYYQILAGHNRVRASKAVGLETIPTIVKDVDDDMAKLILVNTNLNQRDQLLPSEKAFAYKMQMDSMKRQGKRTDLTSRPMVGKSTTTEKIGFINNDGERQVQRFIRLTELIPTLLKMVDDNILPFRVGVNLSYLTTDEQEIIDAYLSETKVKISVEQSEDIKKYSKEIAPITFAVLNNMFKPVKTIKPTERKIKFSKPALNKVWSYIPDTLDDSEVQDYILKALIYYHNNQ